MKLLRFTGEVCEKRFGFGDGEVTVPPHALPPPRLTLSWATLSIINNNNNNNHNNDNLASYSAHVLKSVQRSPIND